jgi:hypothetical protein
MRNSYKRFLIASYIAACWSSVNPARAEVIIDVQPDRLRLVLSAAQGEEHIGQSCLVGIPLEGEVNLDIIETHVQRRVESADQELQGLRLDGPVVLGRVGLARDQRVAEIVFVPRLLDDGTVEFYDKVVVDVHLPVVTRNTARTKRDRWSEMLQRINLVNYRQAQPWRQERQRPLAKPSLQEGSSSRLRVVVREQGLYRISGRDLTEAGISLKEIDVEGVRMLYGGGRILESDTIAADPHIAQEIAVVVDDGGDGRFDKDDGILFYGEGVERWNYSGISRRFVYVKNPYTDENVYWLELGSGTPGLRAKAHRGALEASDPARPESFRERVHVESEALILLQTFGIKSGYEWYWEDFVGNARNFTNIVRDPVDDPVTARFGFFGWTNTTHRFTVKWNDEEVGQIAFTGTGASVRSLVSPNGPQEGLNLLGLVHRDGDLTKLDFYELEYSRHFTAQRGELFFDVPIEEGVAELQLSGFTEEAPRIFEFSTQLREIVDFVYDSDAGTVAFQDFAGNVPRRYVAASSSRWKRPLRLETTEPNPLLNPANDAEYIVITHPDFLSAADRLVQWRGLDDRFGTPLRTMMVDVRQVYDVFSGGLLDPAAIRNFLAYTTENWAQMPFFVVLLGDGSYDYKNNSGISTGNWIPPYQDGDSTYDEWYVRLLGDDTFPDMAIGRLTVQTEAEAQIVVDKLVDYDREPEIGPWQSRVLLVADDLLNPQEAGIVESYFINDAEDLASRFLPQGLDLTKHYIAEYPLEGRTKPQARDEFIRLFNEGAAILTYIGHGNPDVLAHEQMFVLSRDRDLVANGRRLPFFYTAASQVGVFDDPVRTSMPEALLKQPDGGVIGMISATRVGFHLTNMILARAFHSLMYRSEESHVPVGLALMGAKQRISVNAEGLRNTQRYSLFGDPALRLTTPRLQVEMDIADSLKALQEVQIAGRVLDEAGELMEAFNGQVRVQAFDSEVFTNLEGFPYQQIGAPMFRGVFSVQGGRFAAAFRVPKDISYGEKLGRVSAYAWAEGLPTAFGAAENLVLAGTATDVVVDENGPNISIGFRDLTDFVSGGEVPPNAVLRIVISDENGINITGETGHEIRLEIDEQVFAVTNFFLNVDSFAEGVLEYPLPALEPGEHVVRLKAWDTFNNSARAEVRVQIVEVEDQELKNVLFHPNPMRDRGHFTYELDDDVRQVQIKIFSLGGKLIAELPGETRAGFNQVEWVPNEDLANGVYLYHVHIEDDKGRAHERTAVVQVMK